MIDGRVGTTEESRRLIVVVGMHRSGTSVVTNALRVLGVSLGDNLLPPVVGDNDKGYFEDIDVNDFNVEILRFLSLSWDCHAPLSEVELATLRGNGFCQRGIDLLCTKAEGVAIFGIKDPRIAQLLPFWQDVFAKCGMQVSYILAIRHPLSVVKSLSRRSRFDPEKSYLLWLGHVLQGLHCTQGKMRAIIDYDNFLREPHIAMAYLAERLNLSLDQNQLNAFVSEFLDARLRNSEFNLHDLQNDPACYQLVVDVYSELISVAANPTKLDAPGIEQLTRAWTAEFARLTPCLRYMDMLTDRLRQRDQHISTRDQLLKKNVDAVLKTDPELLRAPFDAIAYRTRNPDVQAAGVDPYLHFVRYGLSEGRSAGTDLATLLAHSLIAAARSSEVSADCRAHENCEVQKGCMVGGGHPQAQQTRMPEDELPGPARGRAQVFMTLVEKMLGRWFG